MKTRMRSVVERVVAYGLIVLAIGIFFYFYTIVNRSQRTQIDDLHKRLDQLALDKTRAEEDERGRRAQIDSLNTQLETRRKEVNEKFERLLEKAENYPRFIEQVQRKAKAMNIVILNSTYEQPAPAQGAPAAYLEFRFTLDVKGAYENAKQFLWEMENALGRFVKISKMVVKPPICDADGNMNLSLTLSTFFLP